jgi:hypothetical protein
MRVPHVGDMSCLIDLDALRMKSVRFEFLGELLIGDVLS